MFRLHFHSHKWSRQGLECVEQIHPICTEEREIEGVSEMEREQRWEEYTEGKGAVKGRGKMKMKQVHVCNSHFHFSIASGVFLSFYISDNIMYNYNVWAKVYKPLDETYYTCCKQTCMRSVLELSAYIVMKSFQNSILCLSSDNGCGT